MPIEDIIRAAFHARYQLAAGLLLAALGPLAWFVSTALLGNVLLVRRVKQVAMLTSVCLLASLLVIAECTVTWENGPSRFTRLSPLPVAHVAAGYWNWDWAHTLLWLVMGLSLPLSSVGYSLSTSVPQSRPRLTGTSATVGIVAGGLLFAVLLAVMVWINEHHVNSEDTIPRLLPVKLGVVEGSESTRSWFGGLGDAVAGALMSQSILAPDGYAHREKNDPRSPAHIDRGHFQLAIMMSILLVLYIGLFQVTVHSRRAPGPDDWLPVAFYAVLVLMGLSMIFSSVAFFLDYYRAPVLLCALLGIGLVYWVSPDRDYRFETHDAEMPELLLTEVFNKPHRFPRNSHGRRVLVVVTAPGGGIHASAWTARVLTGLHARYGHDFARSIGIISAVSGGSTGTMHYVCHFQDLLALDVGSPEFRQKLTDLNTAARNSGLEAVGWGVGFPDLCRSIVPLIPIASDRGRMLERRWSDLLGDHGQQTIGGLAPGIQTGKLPVPVFNATEVESGERILFSPVSAGPRLLGAETPVEFVRAFERRRDVKVVTAVRLSASFTYVAPVAAPDRAGNPGVGHLADGGYIDNEGIVTAVDWIDRLLVTYGHAEKGDRPFDEIVLLRIAHQVPGYDRSGIKAQVRNTWAFSVLAPAKTLLNVRSASQLERGNLEVDLEQRTQESRSGAAGPKAPASQPWAQRRLGRPSTVKEGSPPDLWVHPITITYAPKKPVLIPLSWKLTPEQDRSYDEAWDELGPEAFADLDQFFDRRESE